MSSESPWAGWLNAEIYDRFVREYRIYRGLNRRLVELADIAGAVRVLDLACGGGATAEACLRRMSPAGELIGIDASAEMVGVARARVVDPRARFEIAPASRIDRVVSGPFSRAVCNAAFWQFPSTRRVIASLSAVLENGAIFAFNIPAERVQGETSEVHPFQVALARMIEDRVGRRLPSPASTNRRRLERRLLEHGFVLETVERYEYRGLQSELVELMRIPAMIAPLTPELTPEERDELVLEAASRTDVQEEVTVPWMFFVARRRVSTRLPAA